MKKIAMVSMLLVLAFSLSAMADKGSWTGWVSDAHCGAKGNNAQHAACAAKCMGEGQKAVFVVDSDVYAIANQDAIKGHAGHNVKVTGDLDTAAKTVTVDKVEMVSAK